MKRKILFSLISSFFLPCEVFCMEENDRDEDLLQREGDQSIFNEEVEKENTDEDTVNLFQFSTDSIRQLLIDNMAVLDLVKKFISSAFQNRSDFVLEEFMDQYVCCKKIQYLSWKEIQKYDKPHEIVDCFINLGKINNLKTVESTRVLFFVKSLIDEFLATNKEQNYNFKSRSIVNKDLINKVLLNQRSRQRLNKFIKETFEVKKNIDCCQYLNFVTIDYQNTFSVEGLGCLFEKYKFLEEEQDFELIKNKFSNFILELRKLDEDNDEYQSSLDVIAQSIIKKPQFLKFFLISLIDKPICNLNNSDIENFLQNKFQK